jgi:hypothetical protein
MDSVQRLLGEDRYHLPSCIRFRPVLLWVIIFNWIRETIHSAIEPYFGGDTYLWDTYFRVIMIKVRTKIDL